MKALLLLALVCTLTLQQAVLLRSSAQNTNVIYPKGSLIVLEEYYQKYHPEFIGYSAKWIYRKGCGSWPVGEKATFQTTFKADCTSEAYLIIAADDSFTATLNGCNTFKGSDWRTVFRFPLKNLKCGVNTLVITVENSGAKTPAALIFAVTQDQCRPVACLPGYSQDKSNCACVRVEKETDSCKSEKSSRHEKKSSKSRHKKKSSKSHQSKSKYHLEQHSSKSLHKKKSSKSHQSKSKYHLEKHSSNSGKVYRKP